MTDQFLWFQVKKKQLQQEFEYNLLKPDCHSWWISKMQSETLEERYAIKFCFKLGKKCHRNLWKLQTAFRLSCMNPASVFKWHKKFKEGRESVRMMMRGVWGVRKSIHQSWLAKGLGLLCWGFKGVQEEIPSEEVSTLQIGSVAFPPGQCSSPQIQDGHQNSSHLPYSPDLAPCDFCLFPKLQRMSLWDNRGDERGCDEGHWHAHTRGLPWGLPDVVGTVQQVHCSRRRLLRRGLEFHVCTINKSAHTKRKSGNLFNDPCILVYIFIIQRVKAHAIP